MRNESADITRIAVENAVFLWRRVCENLGILYNDLEDHTLVGIGVRKFIQDIAYTRTEQELIDLYIAHYYAYMKHVCSKCKRIRKGYSLWSDTDPQVVYTPVCDRCLTWVGFPPI